MAAFAPSFHQESNDSWLDRLVGDIIDPNTRMKCFSYGQNVDDDLVDDTTQIDHAPLQNQTASARLEGPASDNKTDPSPPRMPSVNDYRYGDCRQQSQSHQRSDEILEELGRQLSFQRHSGGAPRRASIKSLDLHDVDELRSQPHARASVRQTTRSQVQTPLTRHSTMKIKSRNSMPALAITAGQRPRSQQRASSRTSLGRTRSQQELSQRWHASSKAVVGDVTSLKEGDVEMAEVNANDIFLPHPGVRPLDCRAILGEAAGPFEEEDDDDDSHKYPGQLALALIIVGICLSVFIISVDRNVITTAIPKITEEFKTYSDIGWYGSAYFITASGFQPLYGRVYMSFDTRWTFLWALLIFEAGSAIGGASPNSVALIVGRAVQGTGSAGILTGSFVVGTHSVRLQARPILFAFVGMLYGVGALAGPLIGGAFTDFVTWRWAFWINLPVGAITFICVFCFFNTHRHNEMSARPSWLKRIFQLDLIGNLLCIGAATQLFMSLQISESRGNWNNAPVIGLLCGCGLTLVAFIAWNLHRGESALLPPRIMSQRTVAASCGAAFFIYGTLLIHAYYLPIWFQAVRNDSAITSGVHMIPYLCANAIFALLAGAFVSKNGVFAPPAIIGCAIGTVGCGFLATLEQNSSAGKFIGFEILVSAGIGMAIQQGFSAVQTALPLEEVPIGTAAVVASQSLGGAIFVSIGNTILQNCLLDQDNADRVPGVNLRAVLQQGATVFRQFVPADRLPALIGLYNESLQNVFLAAVPLCGMAFLCSLCMEWRSVKTKQMLQRLPDIDRNEPKCINA